MCKRLIVIFLLTALLLSVLSIGSVYALSQETVQTRGTGNGSVSASQEEIKELFARRSQGIHPRVLMHEEDFTALRHRVESDPYSKMLYARAYEYALDQLGEPLCIYELPDGQRLLEISRAASKRIIWCALVYKISGDRRFADRAIEEMLNVCAFSDWHPDHYLDVAQMAYGVGIGYDWLYYDMTATQRSTIAKAIYYHALLSCEGQGFWNTTSNWNAWCHGGLAVAACAVFESYESVCSSYLSRAVTSIRKSMGEYAPLGAFPEGPGYYGVASEFTALFLDSFQSVLGTDFGLSDLPGMEEFASYYLAVNGFVSTFNFGDGSSNPGDRASLHWYAKQYNTPELSVYQRKLQGTSSDRSDLALALLWYDPEFVEDTTLEDLRTDYFLYSDSNESIASFRSFNGDPRQIYAAIKSGYNNTSHSDMDIGTFVMEAMGERWFEELSQENYNVTGYWDLSDNGSRWTYYRKRAEGQNTLVLNPDKTGGQDHNARAQIVTYESTYDGGYATVDLLDAYDSYGMTSGQRSLMLFDNRSRVLLRDEIVCKSSSQVYWFAHTKAEITLSTDKKTATLSLNGKTLEAKIGSPSNAVFEVMDAKPLSTSPNPSGNNANEGIRKLVIHLTGVTKINIAVAFTPVYEATDAGKAVPTTAIANLSTNLNAYAPNTSIGTDKSGVYEIYTADQLCLFAEMVNGGQTFSGKTVRLMADIDLNNRSFIPIGGNGGSNAFKGTFDGNGHVIRNLFVYKSGVTAVGLFGKIQGATVKNLGIDSGMIYGGKASGALIGLAESSTVESCFNRANVSANGSHAGGIIGQLSGTCTVRNSYNTGDVNNTASVAGGIVGYVASSATLLAENCYHKGALMDGAGNCGLIGFYQTVDPTYLCKSVTVTNCYSTQALKGSGVTDSTSVEHYSDSSVVSEARLVSLAVSLGSAYIYDCAWSNEGYPVFSWQESTRLPEDLRLSTSAELRLLAYLVNSGAEDFSGKTVCLTSDIDLGFREWIPIGGYDPLDTKGQIFKGTFDGQGYTVRNLRVSDGLNYMGFFGAVDGTVRNFGIQSGSVSGQGKIAGLAGYARGVIENCYSRAFVYGTEAVGGLVGMASKLTLDNSYVNGAVSSPGTVGGVVGYFSSGAAGAQVRNCYYAGTLTGSSKGGICCSINAKATDISFVNCYTADTYALVHSGTAHVETDCGTLGTADLKNTASALGQGFMADGVRTQNAGYPVLRVFAYGFTEAPTLPVDSTGAYCISTVEELRALAYLVNVQGETFAGKTVLLCGNLDLESRQWIPIGGELNGSTRGRFSGTFDGRGHVISNLAVSSGSDYAGLFGLVSKGTVKNLGLSGGMVLGGSATGALVGRLIDGGTVTDCYSKVNVSGKNHVSALVGMISGKNVRVENCYTTGTAVGTTGVGSFVGTVNPDSTNATVKNCYYVGTAEQYLLGQTGDATTTGLTMSNCYSTGKGALVGAQYALVITDSGRKTEAELRASIQSLGAAYAEDYLVQNELFPVLAWENGDCPTTLTLKDGVYEIGTAQELRLLSYLVRTGNTFNKKKLVLTANIDLGGKPWMAIGGTTDDTNYYFKGQFDGRGHVIRNLNVKDMNTGRVGLFGMANNATIENVGIDSGTVIGYTQAGGICGYSNSTTIRSCYNKALIYGNSKSAGIAGGLSGTGEITDCYNVGLVLAEGTDKNTGGIFGNAADSTKYQLRNCYNVNTHNGIGGNVNAPVTDSAMTNCYSTGSANLLRKVYAFGIVNSAIVSADTLRGSATVLGENYCADTANINHGYPVLTWEMGTMEEALFFDFSDSEADRARYFSGVYGWRNFDDPTQWFRSDVKIASVQTLTDKGELCITAQSTIDDSVWPDLYIDTAIDGANKTFPLNYSPDQAEFFQIRFRMKDLRMGNYIKEGETKESTVSPYLRLSGYGRDMTSISATASYTYLGSYPDSGEYLTVTLPVSEEFRQAEIIGRIRIYLGGVESIPGTQGSFTIDYIYLGPEDGLPTKTYKIDFVNHDGTVLQSSYVPAGEPAVYYGSTPKKTKDETAHYSFTDWDKSLETVSADTVFTARFSATPHSFTYKTVDELNHKATCSCGYNKTEIHAFAYKASKNPTTSSTGTLTGTCSACSGTTTVTLPKLNTTDYKKTTAKAPTCTETGTDKYTWKTTTYGSFYFTVTTAAKGHTEVIDKAVAPTCTATGLTEGKHCSVCNAVLTAQTAVAATGHSYTYKATKNPTTSATGTLTGTCSACSGTTTVNLPKLNTTDYTKTTTKAPTCTATGTDKYTWKTTTYGSFYFTVTTAAKGHAEVIDKAVAPTCTATGLTEGKHCSVCNAILTAQKTVAAMGHSYDEGTLTKAPTLTEEGCLIFTCKNDPAHFYVQSVERLAESLLFHFDNSPAAMERYENYIYGGRNFDQGSQWFHSASKVLHAQTDESTGELVVTAASTADDSLWPDVYIDTAIDGLNKTFPLNYSPANAEYFQIRFRLKNLRFGTYVKEGETKESVVSPYLRLSGYGRQMTSISGTENYTYLKPYIDADEYLTVTLPIGEEFRQAEVIGRIRVYLGGVESVEGTEGTFVIDYIYIGPEKDLPTKAYEVRFLNHDGTLLQSNLVAKGSLAVYYGSTPKKTKDAQAHYTFAGWDGNLDNISADADFTALFTPTAHAYTYSAVTEESHKASCSCGYSKTEVHSYFQGFCPCGAEERKEPLEDPNLNLSHSLNLASDISVNYVILKNKLTGFDMSTVYVESVLDVYEGNEKVGTKTIRLEPVDTGYYYYFTLEGLTAVQMSNRIHSVLHGMKDGQAYFSPMDDYSIADYAYSQLNKTNTTNKLRVLCADLLRYGAKAQIYKNYRTDSLADASMTEEHKLYLSSLDAVTFGSVNADLKDLPGAPIAWAGKSLNLESKVCLKFVFNTSAYTGALENLSLRISYEDRTGATKTLILTNPESYSGSSVLYAFTVESLLAAELRTVVSVQIYSGDSPVSSTLQYSPDTYGNNKTGSLLELCKALFAYSDSAKGYFVG